MSNERKITEHKFERECDGLVRPEEAKWGKYLLTFEHDHLDLVGFNPRINPHHVAAMLADNIRAIELLQ